MIKENALLVIDTKSGHISRYVDGKHTGEITKLVDNTEEDRGQMLFDIECFRQHGWEIE